MLIAVGALFGGASLFHWSVQSHLLALPVQSARIGWIAAGIFTAILATVLAYREPRRTAPDGLYRAARLGILAAIVILWFVLGVAALRFRNPDLIALAAPMVFTLSGGFWVIFSSVQARRQLRWVPVGAFAAAIWLAFLLGTQYLYLVNALALFALFVVPGIVLRQGGSPAQVREA